MEKEFDFSAPFIFGGSSTHTVFRKTFESNADACICYIYSKGYVKLCINGFPAAIGSGYIYADISDYLLPGENTAAFHLFSGTTDGGFAALAIQNGIPVFKSDESFLFADHKGYETVCVTDKAVYENIDCNAPETGSELTTFDDSKWAHAILHGTVKDYTCFTETALPVPQKAQKMHRTKTRLELDFGCTETGFLYVPASGKQNGTITVSCDSPCSKNAPFEKWILSGGDDEFMWFCAKTVRYITLEYDPGTEIDADYIRLLVI